MKKKIDQFKISLLIIGTKKAKIKQGGGGFPCIQYIINVVYKFQLQIFLSQSPIEVFVHYESYDNFRK